MTDLPKVLPTDGDYSIVLSYDIHKSRAYIYLIKTRVKSRMVFRSQPDFIDVCTQQEPQACLARYWL
jgi:hypothetical protein